MNKYFWPASALTESDMHVLFLARQASPAKTTITELVARSVREKYGYLADDKLTLEQEQRKEVA